MYSADSEINLVKAMSRKKQIDYVADLNKMLDIKESENRRSDNKKTVNKAVANGNNIKSGQIKPFFKKAEPVLENMTEGEQLEWILRLTLNADNNAESDALAISQQLLDRFGSLGGIFSASDEELLSVKGVDCRTSLFLRKLYELAGVVLRSRKPSVSFEDEAEMFEFIESYFIGKEYECAYMFVLDSAKRLKSTVKLSEGVSDETSLYVQTISKTAAVRNANTVVIAHNHPGGVCMPSEADEYAAKNASRALNAVGVKLYDSIIVTDGGCYSMRRAGKLLSLKAFE